MICCIIAIGLFIVAFVFGKISKTLMDKGRYEEVTFEVLAVLFFIISITVIAICSVLIVSANVCGKLEIERARDQRSTYISLLKENKDATEQVQLYKDIAEYNSELKANKYFSKSPWTNWFYAKGWVDLEYIEINDYNTQEE